MSGTGNRNAPMLKIKKFRKRTRSMLAKSVRMTTYLSGPSERGFVINDSVVALDDFYDVDFDSDIYFPERMDNVKHGVTK